MPTPGSALPQPTWTGETYGVSFNQPAGVNGVTYGAQWSRDLGAWSPVADSGSGGSHTFAVSKLGENRIFFRYQIIIAP